MQIVTIGYGPLVTPEELRATVTGPLKDNLLIYSQASQAWFYIYARKNCIDHESNLIPYDYERK